MANKVVQLTDDSNNNIYPVAGALKSGSVTTSTIGNGAVTADKIDFTTLINNKKFMQAGAVPGVVCQGTNNVGGGWQTVTFDVPFDNPPIVVANVSLDSGYVGSVMVVSITTTSFDFLARTNSSSDSAGKTVRWIAVDPTKLAIISAV